LVGKTLNNGEGTGGGGKNTDQNVTRDSETAIGEKTEHFDGPIETWGKKKMSENKKKRMTGGPDRPSPVGGREKCWGGGVFLGGSRVLKGGV